MALLNNTVYAIQTLDCNIRFDTHAGYGSTDTKIPFFTNKNTDTSSGQVTIVNNSTNGLRLTIATAGIYCVSYWFTFGNSNNGGISLNSNQLTTNISTITASNRVGIATTPAADLNACVTWTGRLAVNDVIRPHTDGAAGGGTAARSGFSLCKIV